MMKRVLGIILAVGLVMSFTFATVYFVTRIDSPNSTNDTSFVASDNIQSNKPEAIAIDLGLESVMHLTGSSGSILLVDSISNNEYGEMMDILYPGGSVLPDGMDNPGIENKDEERAKYIAEHMKAYTLEGTKLIEVKISPFELELSEIGKEPGKVLFYSAKVGSDSFVFPSEWSIPGSAFAAESEAGVYLIYSDIGIWQIDPYTLKIKKLTTDFHGNMHRDELKKAIDERPAEYEYQFQMSWISESGLIISPDGKYVAYRTNRDCWETSGDTSIWTVNLQTGEEKQSIKPSVNNDIIGFLSNNVLVVGTQTNTRIANLDTNEVIPVDFSEVPEHIIGVGNGVIAYTINNAEGNYARASFSHLNATTGNLETVASVYEFIGYNVPSFSPSGKTLTIEFDTMPEGPSGGDIMLVDLREGTLTSLTDVLINKETLDGYIVGAQWLADGSMILETDNIDQKKTFIIAQAETALSGKDE
jgi:hypothetical protein